MEVIRVSIGTEPAQLIPCEVLKSSILRRTSAPVEFTESWEPRRGWHPKMERLPRGTKFSGWRWSVAHVYGQIGKAIYLDADQIVLTDIVDLWNSLPDGKAFSAVLNAVGIFGEKQPEPNKVQTSVVVMDCSHPVWISTKRCVEAVQKRQMPYRDLMQAEFVARQDIHELPPEWNHFGIHSNSTKLLHYSHVASQPWKNKKHPTAGVWYRELIASIEAGHVSRELLEEECRAGHIDMIYWKRLQGSAA